MALLHPMQRLLAQIAVLVMFLLLGLLLALNVVLVGILLVLGLLLALLALLERILLQLHHRLVINVVLALILLQGHLLVHNVVQEHLLFGALLLVLQIEK